ncbi:hypothetical protein HDEF_1696 [Candidatus Hamiltonella defensa 5AT (Acyrthosiphon pisum)]|uniref:Uncharacterized protein n=1 Tax=Hamiltonella defensa subsp. Acyrthosiphon pisum (strain 5AT) TaxID=572265 RepID=C4K6W0_HAMD5|nr:hypothetical protein HDEF_1696 [Candidatus Hamiltonella defensa 5AT (Acyrthosiphon pisum)]
MTKLLQHHAQYYDQIKINGKKHRPWILVKGKKLDNKEIRESVKQCGI